MPWVKIPFNDQWQNDLDVNASGYVIKCYIAGTTTTTPMAIDKDGSTTVTTATLNADGLPEISGNEVALYMDRTFKYAIYENATDASNDTNAFFGPIDNVALPLAKGQALSKVDPYADYDAIRAINSSLLDDGDFLWVEGLPDPWEVKTGTVTDDGVSLLVFSDDPDRYAECTSEILSLKHFGAIGDSDGTPGNGTDNTSFIQAAIDWAASASPDGAKLYANRGIYRFTGDIRQKDRVHIIGDGLGQAGVTSRSNASTIFLKDGTGFTYGWYLQNYATLEACQVLGATTSEVIAGTSGQTVFNFSTITYSPMTDTLGAKFDSANYPGASTRQPTSEWTETSSTSVTLTSGLDSDSNATFFVYQNNGPGVTIRGRGARIIDVSSTGHLAEGIRIGDDDETNCNFWRVHNVVCRDNNSHGFSVDDAAVRNKPNCNVGGLYSLESRANAGNGLNVRGCIDNTFINIQTYQNLAYGLNLREFSRGNWFSTIYNEAEVLGQSNIESGAVNNYIVGIQAGEGTISNIGDTENFILGHGGGQAAFQTIMRTRGWVFNGEGSDQDYSQYADSDRFIAESAESGKGFFERKHTVDGDGSDSVITEWYGRGTVDDTTNRERLSIGYDPSADEYIVKTDASGAGAVKDIRLESGGSGVNEITLQENDIMLNAPNGIGDGSGTSLTAPAQGSGGGPASLVAVKWIRIKTEDDGLRYWIPLFQ